MPSGKSRFCPSLALATSFGSRLPWSSRVWSTPRSPVRQRPQTPHTEHRHQRHSKPPGCATQGDVEGKCEGREGRGVPPACPLSTRGGTRLVRLVRGRGGGGAWSPVSVMPSITSSGSITCGGGARVSEVGETRGANKRLARVLPCLEVSDGCYEKSLSLYLSLSLSISLSLSLWGAVTLPSDLDILRP